LLKRSVVRTGSAAAAGRPAGALAAGPLAIFGFTAPFDMM
jgi:hypothetical protein